MKNGLSIVIPVYNEENAIVNTLTSIKDMMQKQAFSWEIVAVDDGSTDRTAAIIASSQVKTKLVKHAFNKGYGASLKTGIINSTYNIVAITDADKTYPVERLPEFYQQIDDYSMIVGQRSFGKLPILTRPAKWFITRLANYLTETRIPDINSGLRMFHKADVKRFFPILPSGFSFTSTITIAMLSSELNVKYIPIEYYKREGKSKIRPFYDTLNFIQLIIRTVLYFNPLKIFLPVSLFLFFLALITFLIGYFVFHLILNVTVAILFLTGIQLLAIGMLADLIDKRMKF